MKYTDIAMFWLPIIGGILLGGVAVGAWYGGNKVAGLWLGFGGVVCLLLVAALQVQQNILAQPTGPSNEEITKRQARASVFVETVETHNIDDDLMTIGPDKIPWIRVIIRNSGQTAAHDVTHRVSARVAAFPPTFDFFKLFKQPSGSGEIIAAGNRAVIDVGAGQPLNDSQKTLLGLGRMAVYLFGQIDYTDEFGDKRCTKFRYLVGGPVGFNGNAMSSMPEGNEADKNCDE